jgi:hypothetical protein
MHACASIDIPLYHIALPHDSREIPNSNFVSLHHHQIIFDTGTSLSPYLKISMYRFNISSAMVFLNLAFQFKSRRIKFSYSFCSHFINKQNSHLDKVSPFSQFKDAPQDPRRFFRRCARLVLSRLQQQRRWR